MLSDGVVREIIICGVEIWGWKKNKSLNTNTPSHIIMEEYKRNNLGGDGKKGSMI